MERLDRPAAGQVERCVEGKMASRQPRPANAKIELRNREDPAMSEGVPTAIEQFLAGYTTTERALSNDCRAHVYAGTPGSSCTSPGRA